MSIYTLTYEDGDFSHTLPVNAESKLRAFLRLSQMILEARPNAVFTKLMRMDETKDVVINKKGLTDADFS